jgi:TolB-like protein/Tfp pilus assembly protein PilF
MSDRPPGYQRFFAELKRRRVFRLMAFYGAASFAVLQGVDLLVPVLGFPDSVTQLTAVLLLVGAPVAILLGWVFDWSPEGLQRTAEANPEELTEIISAPAARRWASGLLALAGMMALLTGAWYVGRQSATGSGFDNDEALPPSIAVLPFVNLSGDPAQEFFSDGIAEELLNLLAKTPELRVASRTSAFSFKGQGLSLAEIAERLNVAHVLEGSVRMAGDEVRVTARLVEAKTDTRVWSESWDRNLEDIFALQDEIASEVASSLEVSLLGVITVAEAANPDAYALFLQGRHLGRQRTSEGFQRAIGVLEEALAIDPDYAPAWGELARVYSTQAGSGDRPAEETLGLAREAASRALDIDSEFAPAIAHLGLLALTGERDMAAAAEYYQEALALAPTDTDIIGDAATLLQSLGRLGEAIELKEYVVDRDPVSPRGHHNLGNSYRWAGRWDEAVDSYSAAESLSPGYIGAHTGMGQALLGKGEPEAALEAIQLEPSRPWWLIGAAMAYSALGQQAESDAALEELIRDWERDGAYNIAYVLAFRGEADRAFEWLDKAVAYNDPGLSEIVVENTFANVHDDPRWLPFLESIGKAPSQLAEIEFRVALPR